MKPSRLPVTPRPVQPPASSPISMQRRGDVRLEPASSWISRRDGLLQPAAAGRLATVLLAAGIAAAGAVAAGQGRTVWDGVYTAEQARRGAEAYERACAECHGADLGGGDMAPGLAGVEFVYNWHGFSARDLFERLRVSMPPDRPNRVSRQEKADILAFMLEANDMPAGDTELASRTGPLGAIQFLAEP